MTNVSGKSNWILYVIFLFYCDVNLCKFGIFLISNTETIHDFLSNTDGVMHFNVKAEQRSYIKFRVELGRTPVQTKNLLNRQKAGEACPGCLVYRWHERFSDKLFSEIKSKGAVRPSVITEELTSAVQELVENHARLTVRTISSQFNIWLPTKHKLWTENLGLERICARWVPKLLSSDDRKKESMSLGLFWSGSMMNRVGGVWIKSSPRMRRGSIIMIWRLNNNLRFGH